MLALNTEGERAVSNVRLVRSACLLACLACTGAWAASEAPAGVQISQFRPDKAIYKPGEAARFSVSYSVAGTAPAAAQLWIERELDPPVKVAEVSLPGVAGARQQAALNWTPDANAYGHRAVVRLVDAQGQVLREAEALFDVASDWQNVMRVASIGSNVVATAKFSDAQIEQTIQRMRDAHFNAFLPWTFAPEPYRLAPDAESWPYQYGKPGDAPVVKERLLAWGKAVRQVGFKYIAYDEVAAIAGPPDWRVFSPNDATRKPIAPYFSQKGMFSPNALSAAPRLADELARSIRMFGWDGILLDSAISVNVSTSEGIDSAGRKITTLSAVEVGYRYLAEARKQALQVNPDFRVLAQNATSVSGAAVREPPSGVYAVVAKNGERLKIREFSKVVDLYTAEIDALNEPRDGRYPLTYEMMSVSLNSLVEVLGKPLLAWALLTPAGTEGSISFIRPYLAVHLASRTHVHDHFTFYGGAAGAQARTNAAAQQFIRYNRFLTRFSRYLHDPELRWVTDAANRFAVSGSRPLFWDRTVYRRALPGGGERIVINLLNLPSSGKIVGQTEVPTAAQDIALRFKQAAQPTRVVWLDADDVSLKPVALERSPNGDYRLPALAAWGVVVIETR